LLPKDARDQRGVSDTVASTQSAVAFIGIKTSWWFIANAGISGAILGITASSL